MSSEVTRRALQALVACILFDAPGLSSLRMLVYRRLFEIAGETVFARAVYCVQPHGLSDGHLKVGKHVGINHHTEIDYSGGVIIEDDVWVSQYVLIETHEHAVRTKGRKKDQEILTSNLHIHRDAWIGAFAVVLPSVSYIGEGAIVGAGAIVTHDVGDWDIVGGVPARTIGHRGE